MKAGGRVDCEAVGHVGLDQWSPRTEILFQGLYEMSRWCQGDRRISIYVFNLKNKNNSGFTVNIINVTLDMVQYFCREGHRLYMVHRLPDREEDRGVPQHGRADSGAFFVLFRNTEMYWPLIVLPG